MTTRRRFEKLASARGEGTYQSTPNASTKITRESHKSGSLLNFFFVC